MPTPKKPTDVLEASLLFLDVHRADELETINATMADSHKGSKEQRQEGLTEWRQEGPTEQQQEGSRDRRQAGRRKEEEDLHLDNKNDERDCADTKAAASGNIARNKRQSMGVPERRVSRSAAQTRKSLGSTSNSKLPLRSYNDKLLDVQRVPEHSRVQGERKRDERRVRILEPAPKNAGKARRVVSGGLSGARGFNATPTTTRTPQSAVSRSLLQRFTILLCCPPNIHPFVCLPEGR